MRAQSYQTTRKLPPSGFVRAMRVLCGCRSRSRTRRREVVARTSRSCSPRQRCDRSGPFGGQGAGRRRGGPVRVMGSAGGWLCASLLALSYVRPSTRLASGVVLCSVDRRRLSSTLPQPSRGPPLARVTSQRELNRDVSILSEELRNDVCHRCRTRFSSIAVFGLRTVRDVYCSSIHDDL